MSVEDCSELGGPFLGVSDLTYHRQVYPGVTLRATSETTEVRLSSTNPSNGIVTWSSKGIGSDGETIVSFRRSNLVRRSVRSEEHTSELQSIMRISVAVLCLKK